MKELLVNGERTGTYFDDDGNMYGNVKTILDEDNEKED